MFESIKTAYDLARRIFYLLRLENSVESIDLLFDQPNINVTINGTKYQIQVVKR